MKTLSPKAKGQLRVQMPFIKNINENQPTYVNSWYNI